MQKITAIKIEEINEKWLFDFLSKEFTNPEENITSLKILSKLGIAIHGQEEQLKHKTLLKKFNALLKVLKENKKLALKNSKHGTLGIKENAYKII